MALPNNLWRIISLPSDRVSPTTEAMNVPGGCIVRSHMGAADIHENVRCLSESSVFVPDAEVYLHVGWNFYRLRHGNPKRTDSE